MSESYIGETMRRDLLAEIECFENISQRPIAKTLQEAQAERERHLERPLTMREQVEFAHGWDYGEVTWYLDKIKKGAANNVNKDEMLQIAQSLKKLAAKYFYVV